MHNLTKIKLFRILLYISWPFAWLLLYVFAHARKRNPSSLFFFFDRYAIGGAQRIHLDLLESVSDIPRQVYFTRRSPNDRLKAAFYSMPHAYNRDIHFWCDNIFFRLFSVHYYCFYINRHRGATVLSSNSTFFYDMLPFLRADIRKIELLHNFSYGKRGMEFFGLANHRYLDYRIVYDSLTLSNLHKQYNEFGIDASFLARILFIEPGVEIPAFTGKDYSQTLKVLYAGRGGPQKRVWLLNRIVEQSIREELDIRFEFAGSMEDELSDFTRANATVHGAIGDRQIMNDLYARSHMIILVSAYEGFPMVIKEGMSWSCVPVVTALEGNRMHLANGDNALLIDAIEDEDKVVSEAMEKLRLAASDRSQLQAIAARAYAYAKQHFTKDAFMKKYRALLLENKILPD